MCRFISILLLAVILKLHAEENALKFEGILGGPVTSISNLTHLAPCFLPYNPVVMEIGGYEGRSTINLSGQYPKGQIIVFEPNPRAFNQLLSNMRGCSNVKAVNLALTHYNGTVLLYLDRSDSCDNPHFEEFSSLLKQFPNQNAKCRYSSLKVPCVNLDDWCKKNGVDHIDFIQIDVEGYESQILRSSPEILKTVKVICTKTNLDPYKANSTKFSILKKYLESRGFEMLAHWYREGLQGEATFIRKEVYDALYR